MAITDYATLVAEVKAYCGRFDSTFSARFPTFVALVEDRMYNGHGQPSDPLYSAPIRSKIMELSTTVTMADGEGALPTNILVFRRLSRSGDTTGLQYMAPPLFQITSELSTNGEDPYYYTVEGTTLKVTPVYTGSLALLYYKRFADVTVGAPTGAMISEHGMAYFTGTMFEAFSFMQEVDLAAGWLAKYRAQVAGINRTSLDVRAGGGRVRSIARAIG